MDRKKLNSASCLLFGGFSAANIGDLLISFVALQKMKEIYGDSVAIISANPGYTAYQFPNTKIIPYFPKRKKVTPPSFLKKILNRLKINISHNHILDWYLEDDDHVLFALSECKCLCITGGGSFNDLAGMLDYFLLPIEVASKSNVLLEMRPNGFGPISMPQSMVKIKNILKDKSINVRDEVSRKILNKINISCKLIQDDGFLCKKFINFEMDDSKKLKSKYTIGINICEQYGSKFNDIESWWIDLLNELEKIDVRVEAFCFHADPLRDFARAHSVNYKSRRKFDLIKEPVLNFADGCRQILGYDLIISSRFHPVVIANSIGIHSIAISCSEYYDAKMHAATIDYSLTSKAISPKAIAPQELINDIKQNLKYKYPVSNF